MAKPEAKVHACSILLRGPSKDVMNEIERNLNDAMFVARNVMRESRLVCGGGTLFHETEKNPGPQLSVLFLS